MAMVNKAVHISRNIVSVHFIRDSYVEFSLKEAERLKRKGETDELEILNMKSDTPTPKQEDKFWASERSKTNLLVFACDFILQANNLFLICSFTVSGCVRDNESISAQTVDLLIPELNSYIEEADQRVINHINHITNEERVYKIILLSNDADTLAHVLRYMHGWTRTGLKELWQKYGHPPRMVLVHSISTYHGPSTSRNIIKAHIITGNDVVSKIGSKKCAVCVDYLPLLSNLGESTKIPSTQNVQLAEQYLVYCWVGLSSKTNCTNFDDLRLERFTSGENYIEKIRNEVYSMIYTKHTPSL